MRFTLKWFKHHSPIEQSNSRDPPRSSLIYCPIKEPNDRPVEIFGRLFFAQKGSPTCLEYGSEGLGRILYRQADHEGVRRIPLDTSRRIYAIHLGQIDVHDDHIRLVSGSMLHGLQAVCRLSNHFQIGIGLEDAAKPLADHGMVIHEQHTPA